LASATIPLIRALESRDIPHLRKLHAATGYVWDFPEDLLSARVWADENDLPLMLVAAKLVVEGVVISSNAGTPGMRLEMLGRMMREVLRDADKAGIAEGFAWIPNEIWKSFSRRLRAWGWKPSNYKTMAIQVREQCQKA